MCLGGAGCVDIANLTKHTLAYRMLPLQTPILVSLVKKDAAMLDAFGKGASEDIQASKEVLYRNLTRNPETGESMCAPSKICPKSLPVSPNQVRSSCCSAVYCRMQQMAHPLTALVQMQQMPSGIFTILSLWGQTTCGDEVRAPPGPQNASFGRLSCWTLLHGFRMPSRLQ